MALSLLTYFRRWSVRWKTYDNFDPNIDRLKSFIITVVQTCVPVADDSDVVLWVCTV